MDAASGTHCQRRATLGSEGSRDDCANHCQSAVRAPLRFVKRCAALEGLHRSETLRNPSAFGPLAPPSTVLHHPRPLPTVRLKLPRSRFARLGLVMRLMVMPVRVATHVGRVLALLVSCVGDARGARHEVRARRAEHARRHAGALGAVGAFGGAVHRADFFEQPVLLALIFVDRHRGCLSRYRRGMAGTEEGAPLRQEEAMREGDAAGLEEGIRWRWRGPSPGGRASWGRQRWV